MGSFVALCMELIERRYVHVQDNNLNLLVVNSGYMMEGYSTRLEHRTRNENFMKERNNTGNKASIIQLH